RGMADDQGHILLVAGTECYDIHPDGVSTFPNVQAAVLAAVARGVRRFDADGGIQVSVVGDNQIWIGGQNVAEVHHYDGERWESLKLSDGLGGLLTSPQHGILLRGQNSKFYEYDRGQLKFVTDTSSHTRWLWSSAMMQPYESALLDQRPHDYVIVQHGALTTRVQEIGTDGQPKTVFVPGDTLPRGWWVTLTRGFRVGHWTDYAAGPIYRLLGNRAIQCAWQQTPLMGLEYAIRQVIEDRAGNLWIYESGRVFMKRPGDFELNAVGAPRIEDDEVQFEVKAADAWQGGYQPRMFWRVAGGPWQGGEATNQITIPRSASGDGVVEVIGMDRLGGTTAPLRKCIPTAHKAKQ
ncbi:MAG: hypothetical protein ABI614_28525, partial [Planctomycetota bacterium]